MSRILLGGALQPGRRTTMPMPRSGTVGLDADGNHSGDISHSQAGTHSDAKLLGGHGFYGRAGDWDDNYVQVGHGGAFSRGYGTQAAGLIGNTGDISLTINVDGHITFLAGSYSNLAEFTNEDGRNSAATLVTVVMTPTSPAMDPPTFATSFQSAAAQATNAVCAGRPDASMPVTTATSQSWYPTQWGHQVPRGRCRHATQYRTTPLEVSAGTAAAETTIRHSLVMGDRIAMETTLVTLLFAPGSPLIERWQQEVSETFFLQVVASSDNEWADNANHAQLGHGGRSDQGSIGAQ